VRGHLGQACLSHLLVPRSDWLFVQSDAMLAEQRAGPLHHDRVSVVPMGVDLQRCAAPADPVMVWSCPKTDCVPTDWQGCRVGVYLGTLDRNRELEVLIDATVQVVRTAPDFRLLIIGEADEPADVGALRRYAASRGALRWVHFTGRLPGAQALALAACAQLGLSPVPRTALTEVGSPTKAVEYLACGLPVVCNDQPDQALVAMSSGNGHLAAFSPDGFAQAIEQALCALRSPGAAARAAAARDWVRRHRSYEVIGAQLAAVLTEVIDGHPVRQSARIAPGSAGSR
jgi:glycosyltransferase involved in cell wall biosynthesis